MVKETTPYNSTFAIGGVSYSADSFVVTESLALRMNICAEKPALRKSAKRYRLPIVKTIVKMTIEKINNSALLHMFLFLLLSSQLLAQDISNLKPGTRQTIKSDVHINYKTGGTISKNELLESTGLSLTIAYDSLFQISSFRLTRIRQGETPVEESNRNNGELTEAMRSIINNSRKGDKIYFEYIKCKGYDGTTRSMPALSFVIE